MEFVKEDFDKLDKELLADKIEYIFSTTVDVILGLHTARKAESATSGRYYLDLRTECVPVFEKADKTSTITSTTPPGIIALTLIIVFLGSKVMPSIGT